MLHVVTLVHYWLELHQLLEFARCSSSIYSRLLQDAEQTLCSRDNAGSKSGGSLCRALYVQLPTMVQVAEPETSQSPMLFQPGPRLMPRCSVDTLRRCITSPWLPLVRELRISVSARSAVVMAQAEQEGSDDGNGDGVTQIQQQQLSTVLRSLPNVSRLHLELMVLRVEAFESLLPHLFGRPHSELNCPFPLLDAVELRLTWHWEARRYGGPEWARLMSDISLAFSKHYSAEPGERNRVRELAVHYYTSYSDEPSREDHWLTSIALTKPTALVFHNWNDLQGDLFDDIPALAETLIYLRFDAHAAFGYNGGPTRQLDALYQLTALQRLEIEGIDEDTDPPLWSSLDVSRFPHLTHLSMEVSVDEWEGIAGLAQSSVERLRLWLPAAKPHHLLGLASPSITSLSLTVDAQNTEALLILARCEHLWPRGLRHLDLRTGRKSLPLPPLFSPALCASLRELSLDGAPILHTSFDAQKVEAAMQRAVTAAEIKAEADAEVHIENPKELQPIAVPPSSLAPSKVNCLSSLQLQALSFSVGTLIHRQPPIERPRLYSEFELSLRELRAFLPNTIVWCYVEADDD